MFLLCSCASIRTKLILSNTKPLREKIKMSVNRNADVDMVRDAMPASLLQMDGFVELAPDNVDLLVNAAEAYSGYAFAFIEDTDRERAKKLYARAKEYAFRALVQNEDFAEAMDKPLEEFEESLKTFEKEDVRTLFFATNSWLKWISLNLDDPETLMDIPRAEAMMFRTLELDGDFMYGSPHAMVGAYHAARSKALGGQPEKAKEHFDIAFEKSERKYLVFHLLYARFYAVQIQDRDLFEKTLQEVINAPENLMPERNLANAVAKRKAETLLSQAEEYF